MPDFGMPTLIELMDVEKCAALCRRLSLKFMELNMSFPQYQPETLDVAELKRIKEQYGIYYTIHIDESLDPCNVNPAVAAAYTETMLKTVELAKKLEIPTLNMHLLRGIYVTLPDRRTYVYAENMDFYLEKMRTFRDAVTAAVGDSGIRVCIENTDGYDLPFLRSALELLLESPVFALTLDVGHDHAVNNIDLPVILEHRDRLCHMHLHDALGKNVHLKLGDGELDKDRFLSLAQECSCRVVIETKTLEALEHSACWVQNWVNRGNNPDELWDVYTKDRVKTGKLHRRGELLGDGEYHLAVHVWMRNSRGEYLITRRAPEKGCGGMWESPGGSAVAGDDSLHAAVREIKEETGLTLDPEKGRIINTVTDDHFICDVWLFEQDFDLADVVLLPGETDDVMYASEDTIRSMEAAGQFIPFELGEMPGE